MINPLIGWGKKKLAASAVIIALAGVGVTAALNNPETTQAVDSPVNEQLQHQQDQLDNHDARITNNENDIKDLQNNTNTAPSTTRVYVPVVGPAPSSSPTNNPAPSPAPTPITITAVQQIPDGQNIKCKLTYSDGTSTVKNWYVVDRNDNGIKVDHYEGLCDNSVMGKLNNNGG